MFVVVVLCVLERDVTYLTIARYLLDVSARLTRSDTEWVLARISDAIVVIISGGRASSPIGSKNKVSQIEKLVSIVTLKCARHPECFMVSTNHRRRKQIPL